jgi:hypothetical protein
MNELYEKTIEVEGRVYRYDPDYDCYYRWHKQTPETERERWTKVICCTILLIVITVAGRYYFNGSL